MGGNLGCFHLEWLATPQRAPGTCFEVRSNTKNTDNKMVLRHYHDNLELMFVKLLISLNDFSYCMSMHAVINKFS